MLAVLWLASYNIMILVFGNKYRVHHNNSYISINDDHKTQLSETVGSLYFVETKYKDEC